MPLVHWPIHIPVNYEIMPGQDIEAERRRPDGVIRLVRRPFHERLKRHYRIYRGHGFWWFEALYYAWKLARI